MILTGWKEMANYLRCGVRTVQRWERDGLPVVRPIPGSHAHVIAYSQRLDRWLKRSQDELAIPHLRAEIERTQQLLLTLSKERRQMRLRVNELRREVAAIRARRAKQ